MGEPYLLLLGQRQVLLDRQLGLCVQDPAGLPQQLGVHPAGDVLQGRAAPASAYSCSRDSQL